MNPSSTLFVLSSKKYCDGDQSFREVRDRSFIDLSFSCSAIQTDCFPDLPHRLMKDDIYEGYHIPEGALVHGNQWAIHRDETLYPNPETFNPDRWLNPKYPTFKAPL